MRKVNIKTESLKKQINTAVSDNVNPKLAARELFEDLYCDECSCIIFFCSVYYDLNKLSEELRACLAEKNHAIKLIGCTTAGEVSPQGYMSHSITGLAFSNEHFAVESCLIKDLAGFSSKQVSDLTRTMMDSLEVHTVAPFHTHTFALSFLDGLSIQQEEVLQALSSTLNAIPLLGGSAGDDMLFRDTHVFYDGEFHSNAAVILLVNTDLPFKVMSDHHLVSDTEKMVVTKADPFSRKVVEINAEPAALEYCRVTGLSIDELSAENFALHPLAVQMGDQMYIRSVQKLNDDMSLTFFCAVDVGVVLTTMKSTGMVDHARFMFSELQDGLGEVQLIIACDCIHRRIESQQVGLKQALSDLYQQYKVIGFNTYGEQDDAKHINHTLTCVAIGSNQEL